jgi:hypothetical protein
MRLPRTKNSYLKMVPNIIRRTNFMKIDTILIQPKYKIELIYANNDIN